MADEEKSFFDKLNDILNTPLPGTVEKKPAAPGKEANNAGDDDSLLDRVREILTSPVPGAEASETAEPKTDTGTEESVDDLAEDWWEQDWAEFRAHQQAEREALNAKQRRDSELFARYQEDERKRFDEAMQYDFEVFKAEQQRKIDLWSRRVESGDMPPERHRPPRPPRHMPPPPPWARRRPRRHS